MDNTENTIKPVADEKESVVVRPHHHTRPPREKGRFFMIRQILNIVFMLVGVAGVAVYFHNEVYGIIIVIIAMAFKMAECVLRYVK